MENMIFSLMIAVMSLQMFTMTYRINGVNRTLFHIPLGIFESAIPLLTPNYDLDIYYDKEVLEQSLTYYFDSNLHKYVNDYTLSYYYYNQEDESICVSDKCTAVEITLKADIFLNIKYQKKARFYIRRNA